MVPPLLISRLSKVQQIKTLLDAGCRKRLLSPHLAKPNPAVGAYVDFVQKFVKIEKKNYWSWRLAGNIQKFEKLFEITSTIQ